MNQDLQYLNKPVKVSNNSFVYCPYIKSNNVLKNASNVPVDKICLPNLSSKNPPEGFGKNICKNNSPYHISFIGDKNECYEDNQCTQKLSKCLKP